MKIYSLILIFSLIIVGIVFNLFMLNYIYKKTIYNNRIFIENINLINETENLFYIKGYASKTIYNTDSATLIKITFNNNIEGIIIQEE
ncbi:hypothetical protein SAMN02745164_01067 [Marinitoga hydrogenitolerans DSM 16785]|uniref:Uncharacterized protein n=1 Tax=Marinitoga hydrogenitolerans (strain DSM 16785 / JCM 12826 / AT1271) TaxID=1122195 RepID=A0A1M4W0X0_MARH1|nr:hypothetical protein [Marinitoga hydrogenitolerans]SHE74869.1 hypothetical protein SAMN02745164_01067 [Marinitoga hydrogenitolerans DSM 16785]